MHLMVQLVNYGAPEAAPLMFALNFSYVERQRTPPALNALLSLNTNFLSLHRGLWIGKQPKTFKGCVFFYESSDVLLENVYPPPTFECLNPLPLQMQNIYM